MLRTHMKSAVKYFNKWGWLFDKERARWNAQVMSTIERELELSSAKNKNVVSSQKMAID